MRRNLLIGLGGLVAVALVGVFAVLPLLDGSDDAADEPIVSAAAEAAGAAAAGPDDTSEDADTVTALVDETFEVFTARDPFQQLVAQGGGATPISSAVGGSNDTDGESSDTTQGTSSDVSVDGTVVGLVEVFEDNDGTPTAQVTVNGTGYEVVEGEDFAGRFRALDVDEQCVTFLYGDQRFTLCEGETILK